MESKAAAVLFGLIPHVTLPVLHFDDPLHYIMTDENCVVCFGLLFFPVSRFRLGLPDYTTWLCCRDGIY